MVAQETESSALTLCWHFFSPLPFFLPLSLSCASSPLHYLILPCLHLLSDSYSFLLSLSLFLHKFSAFFLVHVFIFSILSCIFHKYLFLFDIQVTARQLELGKCCLIWPCMVKTTLISPILTEKHTKTQFFSIFENRDITFLERALHFLFFFIYFQRFFFSFYSSPSFSIPSTQLCSSEHETNNKRCRVREAAHHHPPLSHPHPPPLSLHMPRLMTWISLTHVLSEAGCIHHLRPHGTFPLHTTRYFSSCSKFIQEFRQWVTLWLLLTFTTLLCS